jgi:hypothetical protein
VRLQAVSSIRTYDAKLVSREMHRLGAGLVPALAASAAAAASSISLPQSGPSINALPVQGLADNPWGRVHLYLLPLFNGDALRVPMCAARTRGARGAR